LTSHSARWQVHERPESSCGLMKSNTSEISSDGRILSGLDSMLDLRWGLGRVSMRLYNREDLNTLRTDDRLPML
jgi:hypothetical protein